MNLENYQTLVKGVTQEDIDNDISVEICSAYGGMVCWRGKLSELEELLKHEERQVNLDFYIFKV